MDLFSESFHACVCMVVCSICRDSSEHQVRFVRSQAQETLLQAYICVVALLAEPGYSIPAQNVQEMADTLKMNAQDLVQRFR